MSTSLRQQLASYWQRIQFLETENDTLNRELAEAKRRYAHFYDQQIGAPCAEIRWHQEREELTRELAEAREAARNAAAVIGAVYQWVERVEAAGGAKSLPGVAACHAVLTSLRKMRAVLARLDAEEETP